MAAATEGTPALTYPEMRRLGRAVPARLRFTREGKLLVFVAIAVGMGAVNSGNNLLFLVLGVLFSLIITSGVLSELTLRQVTAFRHPAPHLFAGEPALVQVDLHNAKRRFSSFSLEVTELSTTLQGLGQRRGALLVLRPGETRSVHLRIVGTRRGVIRSAGLRISTRFPFGFFEKSRIVPLAERYVVFPGLDPRPGPPLTPKAPGQEEEIARVGLGDEFYGLRDAREAEDARSIAWKVSARRDRLVARENQLPAARRVVLLLSNVIPSEIPSARERLEAAIGRLASLATTLSESGYAVGLATADGGIAPKAGRDNVVAIYQVLARLPVRVVQPGDEVALWQGYSGRDVERVAVVTSDQQRSALVPHADRIVVVGEGSGEETS
ncbi:MAG: DUF58 domain-containing protein [Deltaproteobacteria bacterium]|nr:DUF58 domain-containing protein [Deltaproteobacteria bacterium]MCB9786474.1 DUF58 domain-containing protein [Deltaproteobacteria bacterium]